MSLNPRRLLSALLALLLTACPGTVVDPSYEGEPLVTLEGQLAVSPQYIGDKPVRLALATGGRHSPRRWRSWPAQPTSSTPSPISWMPRQRVRVWSARQADRVRLWIEDDGIGIAPEYQDRIFRPFERLHGVESYPGTGIGLATVHRSLERMDGTSGVVSASGQGSRFWIELAAAQELQ